MRLVREQGDEAEVLRGLLHTRSMLPWYIEHNFEGEERQMLLQAYELRALIVLIDGIDEGADLKERIEEFVVKKLAPAGLRVVLTSRPEGVKLELYEDFVIMNLKPLTESQQNELIRLQITDKPASKEFFDHLSATKTIRTTHDGIYADSFSPEDRETIETMTMKKSRQFHSSWR